ncbi:hypothetical protein AAG906_007958 [Vitis piasezkii]
MHCYVKYSLPAYKGRPSRGFIAYLLTLLVTSGTCLKLSWDNTYNESLREFVKRFGQAVLQIEACSMDAVLQIFKRSICPGTPFFESLAKKPPITMDDLFKRANKYSMLEDDVRLSDFKWPRPIEADPSMRDRSKKCAFHKDHGHTTETSAPKAVINYINGGPSDEEYDSRRKRQKLLRAASIRERINSIRPGLTGEGLHPIDGTIIFPPVDPTRTLQPHRDALILSLEIGEFDVRRSWLTSSVTALKTRTNFIRIQRFINYILGRHYTVGPSWPDHSQRAILGGTRAITFQCHFGTWLHYMKAIPSTYHQMVSFLTNEGQTNLYGDQLAHCYQIAREAEPLRGCISPNQATHIPNSN